MRIVADLIYTLTGLLYLPFLLFEMVVRKKNRTGWNERFGYVRPCDPKRPRIWLHAVSLGEMNATPRLVDELLNRFPEWDIVISSTTDTGFARGVQLYGRDRVFRFPLDFSRVIRRAIDRIRPSMIVLVELELWYNLATMAREQSIPICIVNGRLTERSHKRFTWLGKPASEMFAAITLVAAQDTAIADRFITLGTPADAVHVVPSLKWDTAMVTDRVAGADELAKALGLDGNRPVWVAGSTGPGEEDMLLAAYERVRQQDVAKPPVLIIVPRKPERFDAVAEIIERKGYRVLRRSKHRDGTVFGPLPTTTVILGDTMGELRKMYSIARVVFVGRSLVNMGGSDPMEVAALGKPIVCGPHMDNFALPTAALREAGGLQQINNMPELAAATLRLLADIRRADEMGRRSRECVLVHQGGTATTADLLEAVAKSIK